MEVQFNGMLQKAISEPGIISAAYSAFHSYSLGNQVAAYVQCTIRQIPVGPICTFPGWKEKGRFVKKGEKAISLCMPVTCKTKEKDEQGNETERTFSRFVWRNNWFVLSQTEGEDYAAEVKTPAWNPDNALDVLGITQVPFENTNGNIQGYACKREIAINPIAAFPHKTRFHELAHVVLGHCAEIEMSDSEQTPRDIREVEAESVAFILCTMLDLPGTNESRGYIQSWLSGQEIPEKSAQKIFKTADTILKAGQ